jgi:hypothetical protein
MTAHTKAFWSLSPSGGCGKVAPPPAAQVPNVSHYWPRGARLDFREKTSGLPTTRELRVGPQRLGWHFSSPIPFRPQVEGDPPNRRLRGPEGYLRLPDPSDLEDHRQGSNPLIQPCRILSPWRNENRSQNRGSRDRSILAARHARPRENSPMSRHVGLADGPWQGPWDRNSPLA